MSSQPRNIAVTDLMRYKFPVTAIGSILHRVSGVLLFLFIPLVILALHVSLASAYGFNTMRSLLTHSWIGVLSFIFTAALIYHLIAGIKHLLMDLGLFEGKVSGKIATWTVIMISLVLIIGLALRMWA